MQRVTGDCSHTHAGMAYVQTWKGGSPLVIARPLKAPGLLRDPLKV